MIKKLVLKNYRVFRDFQLDFHPDMNILVGDNDAGKSTVLEAINLALTGRLGRYQLAQDISPYLFNAHAVRDYIDGLSAGKNPPPPELVVELYLEDSAECAHLRGSNNLLGEDAPGVRVKVTFDEEYSDEYLQYVNDTASVRLVPTEYYRVQRLDFGGNPIRRIPASASLIDASAIRLQNGADYYMQRIIEGHLDPRERVELARSYRTLREQFAGIASVATVNAKLAESSNDITDRQFSLDIDVSQQAAWESNLVPHIDELPFQYAGNGERSRLKILLALSRRAEDSHIVLVEEPENHLSFASMNELLAKIAKKCAGKQLIVTTHSSYVLNKLGIANLVLMSPQNPLRVTELMDSTQNYFKRLPGYDTLRLVLSKQSILVEGPSDELVVQRAYRDTHEGRLPIQDGIDVISVGLAAKRFLELAVPLRKKVAVVTDNDGSMARTLRRFSDYDDNEYVTLHVSDEEHGKTLEPQLLSANGRDRLNKLFGTSFDGDEALLEYMKDEKTACAQAIFESSAEIAMPEYIKRAVS